MESDDNERNKVNMSHNIGQPIPMSFKDLVRKGNENSLSKSYTYFQVEEDDEVSSSGSRNLNMEIRSYERTTNTKILEKSP